MDTHARLTLMIYRFGASILDVDKCELRNDGAVVPLEPQVFALLRLLMENRERVVTKDEIVERIWNGRIVSEAAISSRVKSARQAVGDSGDAQQIIRTIPKRGFRFVAELQAGPAPSPRAEPELQSDAAAPPTPIDRPSIAVLPFVSLGGGASSVRMAEAIPHDLIADLSRLRWLFVIARGSSFRFRGAEADIERVREALKVRYCLSGAVEIEAKVMVVTVELCDTRDGGIVWSERFRSAIGDVHDVRNQIVQAVISALELQIPLNEARLAQLSEPENLDAWSAYHLGLHHLFRFSREGNARAAPFFERAIALDPGFARAYAGLSFTHFENAFLRFTETPADERARARRYAGASLELDPLDPFCNLVMGRVFWLSGELEAGLPWLDRAIQLNPNYAQAMYSHAWTETLLGEGASGREHVDAALQLSPLDPLAYGMLGVRSFSHMVLDETAEAALWGERAAQAPGAHALVEMIAAVAHGLNGDDQRATHWIRSARRRHSGLSSTDFFRAFPFRQGPARERVSHVLSRLG